MKRFWICKADNYGQRTGDYYHVDLLPEEITLDRFGNELYKGHFLYDTQADAQRAALS